MLRLGLLVLLIALPARAGQPATASSRGGFSIKHFGEDPKQPFQMEPDASNHAEEWSRGQGERPAPRPEQPAPVAGGRTPGAQPPAEEPDQPESARYEEFLRRARRARGAPAPAPTAPSGEGRTAGASAGDGPLAGELPVDEREGLRDAPAAAGAAARYSLWANLSTPLLLPATKAGRVSPDEAQALGRRDYEEHILGASGGPKASAAVREFAAELRTDGAAAPASLPVVVEVALGPGGVPAAAAALSELGFELDARANAAQEGGKLARFSGSVPAERLAALAASALVRRVAVARPGAERLEQPAGGSAELLVGLRLPAESSPTEALATAAERLGRETGFELGRAVAYQRIPGTSRMVLIVAGRVPVRALGRVLADPSVVKVAPLPAEAPAAAPAGSRPRRAAAGPDLGVLLRHPIAFVISLLAAFSLLGPSLDKFRSGR